MLNRTEYLLTCLAEECTEIGQRASKALRFSLDEVQSGQDLTNAERIRAEYIDLLAVLRMLIEEGRIKPVTELDLPAMETKRQKIEKYMELSRRYGALEK